MRAARDQQRRQPHRPRCRKERRKQAGFALLVVFLMAAAVAYSLYRQLPRAAFESVRDKEQLLIDRGGQYKRAIEVYFAVNKRYPATLDDLEKGDKRYLRRRYKDPLNGKDEWRLIHTNGTMLTDSLVQKPGTQNAGLGGNGLPGGGPLGANSMNSADQQGGLGFGGGGPLGSPGGMAGSPAGSNPAGSNPAGSNNVAGASVASAGLAAAGFGNSPLPFGGGAAGQPSMNAAAMRRPSDRIEMTTPFRQNQDNGGDDSSGNVQNPFDPNNLPPITLTPPPNPQQGNLQPGQPGQDPNQPAGGQPFTLGQPALGQPAQGLNGMPEQQPGQPDSTFPGQQLPGQDGNANTQPLFPPTPNAAQANVLGQLAGQGGLNPQPVFVPAPGANPGNQSRLIQGGQFVPPANQNPQQTLAPNGRGGGLNAGLPPGAPNQAEILINNQLRTPGPTGGLNQNANPLGGNNLGSPGIAGVASTFEGPSIKTYAKREKYQEWEFVFDPAAARTGQQGIQGQAGQAGPLGQNPQQPNQNSPFGQQPAGAGLGSTNPFSPPPSPNQQQGGGIGFPAAPGGGVRR